MEKIKAFFKNAVDFCKKWHNKIKAFYDKYAAKAVAIFMACKNFYIELKAAIKK